ncbi:MAG: CotH kinase family protein [Gemmatimonadetes bacterium]|nr:CotH kinase family protein [Gemmatimonadota bacterium]
MLTIVPVSVIVYLIAAATVDYRTSRRLNDWWSRSRTIHVAFASRARLALNTLTAVALERELSPAPDTRAVNLEVPLDRWNALAGDPLRGFGLWVDAVLVHGPDRLDVELRKRGDTSIHWTTPKVSFTMRTDRRRLVASRRTWGFSVREPLLSYVANRLAHDAGLLAPSSDVVPVFLNGRIYGLFRQLELVDESFLRRRHRMPGNIYRGDAIERGERFKGMPYNLFESAAVWDRVAANDRPLAPPSRFPALLNATHGTTFAEHQQLMAMLDRDEMARLVAVLLVAGDPYHMDDLHNQFWYEDPSSGLFHPIPWDIRLLRLGRYAIPLNTMLRAMLRDPYVVEAVQEHLYSWVRDERAPRVGGAWADSIVTRLAGTFRYEYQREGVIPPVGRSDEVRAILQHNSDSLRTWLDDASVAFGASLDGGTWILDLETRGYTGAMLDGIQYSGRLQGAHPQIVLDLNRNGRLDAADRRLPTTVRPVPGGTVVVPGRPVSLRAGWTMREERHLVPDRIHYRIFLTGVSSGTTPQPIVRNRLTGATVRTTPWTAGELIAARTTWHPWRYQEPEGRRHTWSGNIVLNDTLRLAATDTLLIEPGTTVRLGPEASLVAHGVVSAQGTPEAPIRFERADPGRPWGTVALQGPGASGSRFSAVEFRGGGGAAIDGVEYIGMVNVHWATDVRFDRVVFADNVRSDDTFHAVHAEVTVSESRFERANSDAVDFDISRGAILNSDFDLSGGDAIDLMASAPLIAGNTITRSMDKGISIGEASDPLVVANTLRDNAVAIEVKDASEPRILRNDITGNEVGIRVTRKNWRYGIGGWPKVLGNMPTGNTTDFVSDAESRLTTAEEMGPDGDSRWVLTETGIELEGDDRGAPAHWRLTRPRPPMIFHRYEKTLNQDTQGWRVDRGVRRLYYDERSLVVSFRQTGGSISLPVYLTITGEAILVLELASRGLVEAEVVVDGGDRDVTRRLRVPPEQFRYITVPLPPGHYQAIRLTGYPQVGLQREDPATGLIVPRYGRLALRSLAVYDMPERAP